MISTPFIDSVINASITDVDHFMWEATRLFFGDDALIDNFGSYAAQRQAIVDDYEGKITAIRKRIDRLVNATLGELTLEAAEWLQDALSDYEEERERVDRYVSRCQALLDQVVNWQPPSPDHEPLKAAAIDQLRKVMKSNSCLLSAPSLPKDLETWRARRLDSLTQTEAIYRRCLDDRLAGFDRDYAYLLPLYNRLPAKDQPTSSEDTRP